MRTIGIAVVPPWREQEHLDALPVFCREAGISDLGYMIQCHPESYPLMKKIDESLERFVKAREILRREGVGIGVLLQTTVNHGERYRPISEIPFQRIVGADGVECPACFCPVDEGFRSFMFDVAGRLASAGADFLLIDDDFRLSHHAPADYGCFCGHHLAMFAEEYGAPLGRDALVAGMGRDETEAVKIREAWLRVRKRSYMDFCRGFREAIDRVDPAINAGYCNVRWTADLSEEMARCLAGENRPFIRLNAGIYMNSSPGRFANAVVQTAAIRELYPRDVECLSEADTCPHNRYSLSAAALRAYIAGTLLAGTDGPKLWIANCQEWYLRETDRYRREIGASARFFDQIIAVSEGVEWLGPCTPQRFLRPVDAPWDAKAQMWNTVTDSPNWAAALLGRFGMPWSVRENGSPVMLAGDAVRGFSGPEIDRMLSGAVLLDGKAAAILASQGYAELLGVTVKTGGLMRISHERYAEDEEINGRYAGTSLAVNAAGTPELVPVSEAVRVVSSYVAVPHYQSTEESFIAPAVTLFENAKGGRVAVFAAIPGFGILATPNDRTKEQLIGVLGRLGGSPVPVWTVDTADVLLRFGALDAKTRVLAAINLNPDDITPLQVRMPGIRPSRIEHLKDDGAWSELEFTITGETVTMDVSLSLFRPFVARVHAG